MTVPTDKWFEKVKVDENGDYVWPPIARGTDPFAKKVSKGDVSGHEFHGNRYTGGIGARAGLPNPNPRTEAELLENIRWSAAQNKPETPSLKPANITSQSRRDAEMWLSIEKAQMQSISPRDADGYVVKGILARQLSQQTGISMEHMNNFMAQYNEKASWEANRYNVALKVAWAARFGGPVDPVTDEFMKATQGMRGEDRVKFDEIHGEASKLVDAMYDNTQKFFADNGIKEVTLYRGLGFNNPGGYMGYYSALPGHLGDVPADGKMHDVSMPTRSVESYTTQPRGAATWNARADHGFVVAARVPVERIASTCFTGIGYFSAHEFLVAPGEGPVNVSMQRMPEGYDRWSYDPQENGSMINGVDFSA